MWRALPVKVGSIAKRWEKSLNIYNNDENLHNNLVIIYMFLETMMKCLNTFFKIINILQTMYILDLHKNTKILCTPTSPKSIPKLWSITVYSSKHIWEWKTHYNPKTSAPKATKVGIGFLGEFCQILTLKKIAFNLHMRGFFIKKNAPNSPDIGGFFFSKCSDLYNKFKLGSQ